MCVCRNLIDFKSTNALMAHLVEALTVLVGKFQVQTLIDVFIFYFLFFPSFLIQSQSI